MKVERFQNHKMKGCTWKIGEDHLTKEETETVKADLRADTDDPNQSLDTIRTTKDAGHVGSKDIGNGNVRRRKRIELLM